MTTTAEVLGVALNVTLRCTTLLVPFIRELPQQRQSSTPEFKLRAGILVIRL